MGKDSSNKNPLFLPPKNKLSSNKEWEEICWKIIKDKKLLDSFITSNERHNIIMRALTLDLISSGKSTRQISKTLQISLQTINSIKKISEGAYKSYRERSKTERKKKAWSRLSLKKKEPYRPHRRTKYGKVYL